MTSSQTQGTGQPSQSTPATANTSASGSGTLDPEPARAAPRRPGSRLRKRSVCRTAAEWDLLDRQAREDGKDLTNRSNINSTQPKMGGG